MANRIAATYSGSGTATSTHTITWSAPTPGARLIVCVTAWRAVSTPSGWTLDASASAYNYLYVFSKVATSSDTSISLSIDSETRLHAVVHERDDCTAFAFQAGTGAGTSSVSVSTTVPSGTSRVFAFTNNPNGSAAPSWDQGLTTNHTVSATSSNSAFASGAAPAAGPQTFTASGLSSGGNSTGLLVVGYSGVVPPQGDRVLAVHNGTGSSTTTWSWSDVKVGARLILAVSSQVAASSTPAGWTLDQAAPGPRYAYIYSKIATASDLSVSWSPVQSGQALCAAVFELDIGQQVLFGTQVSSSSGTSITAPAVTVPPVGGGAVITCAYSASDWGSSGSVWSQGVVTVPGTGNCVGRGPVPTPGSATYSVSGGLSSSAMSLAVAGYGIPPVVARPPGVFPGAAVVRASCW
ncbi:hypothetical protein ACQP25_44460 (plasmid) [Microtetraspora malaysiensis]|uniref:hypothetical protein n=1 Tax=Microtetraspora malaysiensis TaxID=161358 RepID=UPI003D9195FD